MDLLNNVVATSGQTEKFADTVKKHGLLRVLFWVTSNWTSVDKATFPEGLDKEIATVPQSQLDSSLFRCLHQNGWDIFVFPCKQLSEIGINVSSDELALAVQFAMAENVGVGQLRITKAFKENFTSWLEQELSDLENLQAEDQIPDNVETIIPGFTYALDKFGVFNVLDFLSQQDKCDIPLHSFAIEDYLETAIGEHQKTPLLFRLLQSECNDWETFEATLQKLEQCDIVIGKKHIIESAILRVERSYFHRYIKRSIRSEFA